MPATAANEVAPPVVRAEANGIGRAPGPPNDGIGDGALRDGPLQASGQAPLVLSAVVPSYPAIARRRGIEGQVVLEIIVDQAGNVEQTITLVESLPLLDQAAIDAIQQWRFAPARDRDGHPVRARVRVPVRFTLR